MDRDQINTGEKDCVADYFGSKAQIQNNIALKYANINMENNFTDILRRTSRNTNLQW